MKKILYNIYLWIFALPLAMALTFLTAVLTMLFSPVFPKSRFAHAIPKAWARAVCLLLLIRVKTYGKENINTHQSYVYISNHQSIIDIFVIYGWLPSVFKWMMKAELFKIPFVGWACKAAGHIFLDRSAGIEASKSIAEAKRKLQDGISIVIFPEGSRTHNGQMQRFKRGAFRIAGDLRLPVLPVTLSGSYRRLPRNHGPKFSPGTVKVYFHQPIDLTNHTQEQENALMQQAWDLIASKL
ncbi:MAG: 1-acyl-sn-glycerol-3-phosphate acyltransferase [Prevotellaceae bacterium]|jgi:1-acyl-sn-glycerol-3-phosphate acyltransferase|nr:1-acyl-sn-glycerol-3-phosphate acyltransferase [Prevotellaceae bacterium]